MGLSYCPTLLLGSLELRSGAYHAPALPVELYQRSWRGDSSADHGLTRPALFPLSYTSTKTLEVAGRTALPHDLLCRQTTFCLGYATSKIWSGVRELHPCFRTGDPGYCSCTNSALERAARVELASSGWRPEAPAAIPCSLQRTLAVATGVEPVPPDRQSGILPIDSATTSTFHEVVLPPEIVKTTLFRRPHRVHRKEFSFGPGRL